MASSNMHQIKNIETYLIIMIHWKSERCVMATKEEHVIFQLNAMCRYDDEAKAFVGYLPRLQVYSQGRTEEELTEALRVTALQFIIACANKHILGSVMREGGSQPVTRNLAEKLTDKNAEFVAVLQYKERDLPIEVSVPLNLIAEQESVSA